jgi:protein-S-isoprenylcysteine O-methyltransferase Ste14
MGAVDWLYILNISSVNLALLLSGLVLLIASVYIAMLASRVISVSTVADMRTDRKAELVTDGLYSRIRHPLYLATVLMFASLVLIYPFPKVGLFSLGMIIYLIIGAKLEEHKLIKQYGEDYIQYMDRAGFLLPWL